MPIQMQRGPALASLIPNVDDLWAQANADPGRYMVGENTIPVNIGGVTYHLQKNISSDGQGTYLDNGWKLTDPNDHGKGVMNFDPQGGLQTHQPWREASNNMLAPALAAAGMMFGLPALGFGGEGAGAAGAMSGMDMAADTAGWFGGGASAAPSIATSAFEAPTAVGGWNSAAAPGALGSGSFGLEVPGMAATGGELGSGAYGVAGAGGSAGVGAGTNWLAATGAPLGELGGSEALGFASGLGGGAGNIFTAGNALKYGAPLLGSMVSASATQSAAGKQQAATDAANAALQANYQQTRADLAPWRQTGMQANNALADAAGVSGNTGVAGYGSLTKPYTGESLTTDPGYQFGLAEGQRAIDNRALSGGSYLSGGSLKQAARYGTDYAGTKFNEGFNRDMAQKNQVAGLYGGMSTAGQNAANMTSNAGQFTAGQTSGNLTANGNAQGGATIAGGNAINTALTGTANSYAQDELLRQLLQQNGGNALQQAATARVLGGNYGFGGR